MIANALELEGLETDFSGEGKLTTKTRHKQFIITIEEKE